MGGRAERSKADGWSAYNQTQVGREPRALCRRVARLAGPGCGRLAVDLGCGAGVETRHLVSAGWRVLAIDADPQAPARVLDGLAEAAAVEVTTQSFETARLPEAELVHAGLSLPFLAPDAFAEVWRRVTAALAPGGWLAVDLFGIRDSWAGSRSDVTFHDEAEVRALVDGLELVELDEEERDAPSFSDPLKHWHVYHVIARQPG